MMATILGEGAERRPVPADLRDLGGHLLAELVTEGEQEGGRWSDERGTADGLMALRECLPVGAYPRLQCAAADWLARRAIYEPKPARRKRHSGKNGERTLGASWQEEIWDTSVAMMALRAFRSNHARLLDAGEEYLRQSFQRSHRNWNDEPWETLWGLLALHSLNPRAVACTRVDAWGAINWLSDFVDRLDSGLLINAHYTGLFLLVAARFVASSTLPAAESRVIATANRCAACLVHQLEQSGDDGPWTGELWSNSLVLWGLAEWMGADISSVALAKLLAYYTKARRADKAGDAHDDREQPTEDRAFASVALFKLYVWLKGIDAAKGQSELAARLDELRVRDYSPHVKFFSRDAYPGYFTVNVSKKWSKSILVAAALAPGPLSSIYSQPLLARIAAWSGSAIVGALATLATVFGFTVTDLFRRSHKTVRGRSESDKPAA